MSILVRLQKATELIHNYFVSHLKIVVDDKKLILMMLIISYLSVFYIQRSFVHRKFDISNTFNAKYLKDVDSTIEICSGFSGKCRGILQH